MRKMRFRLLIVLAALVLCASALVFVSLGEESSPAAVNDGVVSVLGQDRALYLLPGTVGNNAVSWKTAEFGYQSSFPDADYAGGDSYWLDLDYYRDANTTDEFQLRLRGAVSLPNESGSTSSVNWIFRITSDGRVAVNSAFFENASYFTTLDTYGWHRLTMKISQTHEVISTADGYAVDYTYTATLYIDGTPHVYTVAEENEAAWAGGELAYGNFNFELYHVTVDEFGNETVTTTASIRSLFYGIGNAIAANNTQNYVLARNVSVSVCTEQEHTAAYGEVRPINYYLAGGELTATEMIDSANGDACSTGVTYAPYTDSDGNTLQYAILQTQRFIRSDAGTLALPTPTNGDKVFVGWTYEGQTTPVKDAVVSINSLQRLVFTAVWEEDVDSLRELIGGFTTSDFGTVNQTAFSNSPYSLPAVYPTEGAHPRLLFTESSLSQIRQNLMSDKHAVAHHTYMSYSEMEFNGILPAVTNGTHNMNYTKLAYIEAKAFRYALTGEEIYGYEAIYAIKNYILTLDIVSLSDACRAYGYTMYIAACVYDWCYDLLTEADKEQLIAGVETQLAPYMEVGFPPSLQGGVTGHGCEAQVLRDYLAFAIAVYDEEPRAYEYVVGRIMDLHVPPADWYMQSGSHWQGTAYGPNRYYFLLFAETLIDAMTNGEASLFADTLKLPASTFLQHLRPDGGAFRVGDDGNQGAKVYITTNYAIGAFYAGMLYGDQTLSANAYEMLSGYTKFTYENVVLSPVMFLSLSDPALLIGAESELPLVQYNGSPLGVIIARSAWDDKNAVAVYMKIGEAYSANHEHKDAGNFQIYYKGILASKSGVYDSYNTAHATAYYRQTISCNSLLIYNPNLQDNGAWIYSGGQSIHRPNVNNENPTLSAWLAKSTSQQASILGHGYEISESGEYLWSYLAGDLTNAYDSETVDEVSRYMLSIMTGDDENPMAFIVYDRITAKNPSYQKTFLLHSETEPIIDGVGATIVNGGGKLYVESLLTDMQYTKIGGTDNAFNVGGVNYAPQGQISDTYVVEQGWGRLELSPLSPSATDLLLTVMYVTDAENNAARIQATEISAADVVGAEIFGKAVLFPREQKLLTSGFSFTSADSTETEYYIAGITSGVWTVSVNGQEILSETVDEGGILTFTAAGGEVTLTPTYYNATLTSGGQTQTFFNTAEITLPDSIEYWISDGEIYAGGSTVQLTADTAFYAVEIALLDGACIRLSDGAGLRFETQIKTELLELLEDNGYTYTIGTLVVPTDLLTVEFTEAALQNAEIPYVCMKHTDEGVQLSVNGENSVFYASLVNILQQNYARRFSAISYIEITDGTQSTVRVYTEYSEEANACSVYEAAGAAYADTDHGYTDAQMAILQNILDSVLVLDEQTGTIVLPVQGYISPYSVPPIIINNVITITKPAQLTLVNIVIGDKVYADGWTVSEDGTTVTAELPDAPFAGDVMETDCFSDAFGKTIDAPRVGESIGTDVYCDSFGKTFDSIDP